MAPQLVSRRRNGIKLSHAAWNTIGEEVFILGRKKAPSKSRKFFAPLAIVGCANEHRKDVEHGREGNNVIWDKYRIAFPHGLRTYKNRFLKKNCCVEDPAILEINFRANQFNFSDGLYGHEVKAMGFQAYTDFIENEEGKAHLPSAGERVYFQTAAALEKKFKECAKFCHYFISYNPFFETEKDAYNAAQAFYEKFAVGQGLTMKDLQRLMHTRGVMTWFVETLQRKRIHVAVSIKGPNNKPVFDEEESNMLTFFRCLILHLASEPKDFLPQHEGSKNTLLSMQLFLKDDKCPPGFNEFDWLLEMELSETAAAHEMGLITTYTANTTAKQESLDVWSKLQLGAHDVRSVLKQREEEDKVQQWFQSWMDPNWKSPHLESRKKNFQECGDWFANWEKEQGHQVTRTAARMEMPKRELDTQPTDRSHELLKRHLRPQHRILNGDLAPKFKENVKFAEELSIKERKAEIASQANVSSTSAIGIGFCAWDAVTYPDGGPTRKPGMFYVDPIHSCMLNGEDMVKLGTEKLNPSSRGRPMDENYFMTTGQQIMFKMRTLVDTVAIKGIYEPPALNSKYLISGDHGGMTDTTYHVLQRLGMVHPDHTYPDGVIDALRWMIGVHNATTVVYCEAFFQLATAPVDTGVLEFIRTYLNGKKTPAKMTKPERILWTAVREIHDERDIDLHTPPIRNNMPVSTAYSRRGALRKSRERQDMIVRTSSLGDDEPNPVTGFRDQESLLPKKRGRGWGGLNPTEMRKSKHIQRCEDFKWNVRCQLYLAGLIDTESLFKSESDFENEFIDDSGSTADDRQEYWEQVLWDRPDWEAVDEECDRVKLAIDEDKTFPATEEPAADPDDPDDDLSAISSIDEHEWENDSTGTKYLWEPLEDASTEATGSSEALSGFFTLNSEEASILSILKEDGAETICELMGLELLEVPKNSSKWAYHRGTQRTEVPGGGSPTKPKVGDSSIDARGRTHWLEDGTAMLAIL